LLRCNKGVRFAHGTIIGRGTPSQTLPKSPPSVATPRTDRNTATEKPKTVSKKELEPVATPRTDRNHRPKRSRRGKEEELSSISRSETVAKVPMNNAAIIKRLEREGETGDVPPPTPLKVLARDPTHTGGT